MLTRYTNLRYDDEDNDDDDDDDFSHIWRFQILLKNNKTPVITMELPLRVGWRVGAGWVTITYALHPFSRAILGWGPLDYLAVACFKVD